MPIVSDQDSNCSMVMQNARQGLRGRASYRLVYSPFGAASLPSTSKSLPPFG